VTHLEHLLDPAFDDFEKMDVSYVLSAQASTAGFLAKFASDPDLLTEDNAQTARAAFAAVTNTAVSEVEKKAALASLRVPEAVKHLSGMLTQYDWDYVEQAKEIRGYVVAKLMEETSHPDARIRLAALKALGTVTEVGAFTERIEIKKIDATSEELTERLRAKLSSLLPRTIEVETVVAKS
jgi:hypothetical protein